jgi:hypothetical protein
MIDFNQKAKEIYEQNKAVGWWDDPDRCKYQTLQLVSTEISEATEGERKSLMDDHLPHRKMGEVELADALIRILDMGGAYGWEYLHPDSDTISEMKFIFKRMSGSVAGLHLGINMSIAALGVNLVYDAAGEKINELYSVVIYFIEKTAEHMKYDIEQALLEKLEYNKHRADHKRENRAKPGGKSF